MIPYLAARTPATTRFGNIYLALAYQAQATLNDSIHEEEVIFLAEKMSEAANFYANKEKIRFSETLEAKQFLELTGISLDDMHSPEKLKQAIAYINEPGQPMRRLDFEAEIAPFHVRYYTRRLPSNAINGASKFKRGVACSGTVWNHKTYHRGFGQAELDKGTEGSILNLLTERAKTNPNCIDTLKNTNLESFFDIIRQHPNKHKMRALVDGGGLLRDYANETIAKEFMNFFQKEETNHGPKIDGIIYLHKFSPEQVKNGYPEEGYVLLKKGQSNPIYLKNPSTENIEKHGVKKENTFAFFDESRATGTNILLDDEALFFYTVDHRMPVRTFIQEVMRARRIFKGQQAEYLATEKGRSEMLNGGQTFIDLKNTVIKNEAVMLKDQKDRSRLAQIDDIVRSAIVRELINETNIKRLEELIEKYEHFLVFSFEDSPYGTIWPH